MRQIVPQRALEHAETVDLKVLNVLYLADIKKIAVWQFRRVTALPFLRTDLKYAPRSGAAYLWLFRLKFRSYGRFRCLVGCLSVLAQNALISAETPFDFVGGGALHIVGDMGA